MSPRPLAAAICFALAAAPGCGAPPPRPEVNRTARLEVRDTQGGPQDIEGALARGETVALVFWQTWCKPCKREAPAIAAAHRSHGDAIRFIGVVSGEQDQAEIDATARDWGMAYPQVVDADLTLATRFDVYGTPTVVVLREDEVVYRGHRPPEDWTALRGPPLGGASR